ncbi:MAG: GNAT family N-acetyltransferase [Lachnospiraceae bacterium]|nr:GNAT family N-acetyltransferase [Lachnospiraceae bacterium]
MAEFNIRKIGSKDNAEVERLIRDCLIEYGADHEGTAWADPMLGRLSEVYKDREPFACYWVALDEKGTIVGSCGIGTLTGESDVCELQKLYVRKDMRGTGLGQLLLDHALTFAKLQYRACYLETCENMNRAKRFYEKNGFVRTDISHGDTGHCACEDRYIKVFVQSRPEE